ncbi:MAG: hypothetical protein DK303_000088 [Chloroflexi bacterium]|jgi:hypothetical protein|nr:MAG: hypothetical protein DK303_000088 [Chloroflexota bacterium]
MGILVILTIPGCFLVESEEAEPITPTQEPTFVAVIVPVAAAEDKHSVTLGPSPISIATSVPIPTVPPVNIREILKPEVEDKTLQEKTLDSVSKVNSFKYILEGIARVDAGGILVAVPLSATGAVTSSASISKFEANLLGIRLYVESAKSGDNIYTRESSLEEWKDSQNLAIGHISDDFFKAIGDSFLKSDLSGSHILITQEKTTFLFSDSGPVGSVTPLFELIATEEESRRFSPEKWKVNLEVDSDNYEISKIISEFSLSNGGQFLSEVFGMEGLSGVGSTDVELVIRFSQIGEDFPVVIPQPTH